MENENETGFEEAEDAAEETQESATRARNKTVMLTPEVTGEVRARLAQEMQGTKNPAADAPFGGGAQASFGAPGQNQAPSAGQMFQDPSAGGRSVSGTYSPAMELQSPHPQAQIPQAPMAPPVIQAAVTEGDRIIWKKEGRVMGFLVSYDNNPNGEVFDLRVGRLIVTSEAGGTGNYLFVEDDTVSPMHAILRVDPKGSIQVLDQLSEHGTIIRRFGESAEETLSGDKSVIEHGDVIKFGERKFILCMITVDEIEE